MSNLPEPLKLEIRDRKTLNDIAVKYHYMHRSVHQRACPFGWVLTYKDKEVDDEGVPFGIIMYSSIHYTKLKGVFGYEGLPTRWQVLSLSRLWINPVMQKGGKLYSPDILPGYVDRKGVWRSTLATSIILESESMVQKRWLEVHPPRYLDQPYHVLRIISYADTRYFDGTIYIHSKYTERNRVKSFTQSKNTRGVGMEGAELICYVKSLPEPEWVYVDQKGQC